MSAPEQPGLSLRIRLWLMGVVAVNIAAQLTVALSGIDLPEPTERSFSILFASMGVLSLVPVLFALKVDRRAVGLTLGDPKTTVVRTGQQLLILGGLAALYTVAIVVAARTGRVKIPVAPTSMTDPHTLLDFCVLAVLVAPLYEEFIFRAISVSALESPSRNWVAILVSAFLFCVPHYVPGRGLAPFIGPFMLGVFLGWSYLRTRSILTPFLVHAAFNSGVIIKDLLMMHHPDLLRRVLGYQ